MEKSSQSSFFKSLALAFGDGLLFGVAMKLAQGPSKLREDEMTDLGPLAERLRNVEGVQTIDKDALAKFGEGLDGRVLEKVIVALEARLTEHVGQVDRRLAEIDAQVALDLKAVDVHTAAQTNAVEKAIQQIETQVRDYVSEAQQANAEQIAGVDQKLSALQEALPAKFREIVEAVRQSMDARVALELTELENRVAARGITPDQFQEAQANLRSEVEALSSRFSAQMRDLAEQQQSQAAPLQQALQQLETKLTTLREELPPKIRQIVEAVEASMEGRISAGEQQAAGQIAGLEQALAALKAEMPSAGGFKTAIEESLRNHAEQVGALDQKLTVLQAELPPKIKAIVEAVRESFDARMAIELQAIDERHGAQLQQAEARLKEAQEQFHHQLAAESKTPQLEQSIAALQADLAGIESRIADHYGAQIQQLEARLNASQEQLRQQLAAPSKNSELEQNIAKLQADVAALDFRIEASGREVSEQLTELAQNAERAVPDHTADLEKALQYASLLEARIQSLEQKLQQSELETVERAVERVWQALEARLSQRQAPPAAAAAQPVAISGLRQKSTSAEQSVFDLIAGLGQLFEKPAPRPIREPAAPAPAQMHAEPAPEAPAEPAPVAATHIETEPPRFEPESAAQPAKLEAVVPAAPPQTPEAPQPELKNEPEIKAEPAPEPTPAPKPELVKEAPAAFEETPESRPDDKPPVILFKPKDSGRKWRIPFVSSFLLMAVAIAWLEFM